jgi:Rieske Fe-S protein
MQRRDFLKDTCRFCLLGAAGLPLIELAGCSSSAALSATKADIVNNKVQVPLSLFDTGAIKIVSPKKYPYQIAVQKKQDGTYNALLLRCTHQDNQLTPTGTGYTCSAHGSRFDKEGNVLKGPAEEHLERLKTTVTNQYILVHL